MLFNPGQEDKLQIDGINRLIKAMQEMASPTPTLSSSRPQVAKTSSQPIAKVGNSRAAATSGNSSNVARTGNMQTASMRSGTPVSTGSRSISASGSPSSSQNQATSPSSLNRSQAVQGGKLSRPSSRRCRCCSGLCKRLVSFPQLQDWKLCGTAAQLASHVQTKCMDERMDVVVSINNSIVY